MRKAFQRNADRKISATTNEVAFANESAVNEYVVPPSLQPIEKLLVDAYLDTGELVLDIGCGAGRTSAALTQAGFEVVGVDLSEPLVRAARTAYPNIRFHHADVRSLPFPDASCSQVLFSFNGLDYLYPRCELDSAMQEIARVLRPGGILIYSGHNIIGRFGRHLSSFREFLRASVRIHPQFLSLQLRGSRIGAWYWRYAEPFGHVIAFSAPPFVHRILHRRSGFETLVVRGPNNEASCAWLTLREHHIHYVVKKL